MNNLLNSLPTVLAQASADGAPPSCGMAQLMPIILMLGVVYFILLRPQAKQAKEHKQMLAGLKKGDDVITQGGVVGKVFAVTDQTVSLEVARDVRMKVIKSHVVSLYKPVEPGAD